MSSDLSDYDEERYNKETFSNQKSNRKITVEEVDTKEVPSALKYNFQISKLSTNKETTFKRSNTKDSLVTDQSLKYEDI